MENELDLHSKPIKKMHWSRVVLSVLVILFLTFFFFNRSNNSVVEGLFVNAEKTLDSTNGVTNLVFMGKSGEGNEGADLTDSMMFVSFNHITHSISITSIPRDIWVTTMRAKVNTAYYYGNLKREGAGLDLAKSAVSEITGQPVHYAIALDFDGFIELINVAGGIEVNVERAFDDFKYPIPGNEEVEPEIDRYEHLHFDAGLQVMDGETALKFARSRQADGEEGTDFARSARQQKIIISFKDKLLSTETLFNLQTLNSLSDKLKESVDTDIANDKYAGFLKLFVNFRQANQSIESVNIDDYLFTPKNKSPYDGQWVLVPVNDWDEIHEYIDSAI